MALLDVLCFPDPRLRIFAKPVADVNDAIRKLIADMFETMYAEEGVGLAATQVNRHIQVIVMDLGCDTKDPRVLINPELLEADGEQFNTEGCLSVPGASEKVKRAEHVVVKALNEVGEVFTWEAEGLAAVCIQHEMDHLKGKLYVDYLSPIKRAKIEKQIKKQVKA